MKYEPDPPVTLNLSRDRYLDAVLHEPDDPADQDTGNEDDDDDDDLLTEQEIARERKIASENLALGLTDDEREDLWSRFRDRQWMVNAGNIVTGLLFFFGAHAAFEVINRRLAGPAASSEIQLFPSPYLWWPFSGFGAFCLAWYLTMLIWAPFGNSRTLWLYLNWARRTDFGGDANVFGASGFNRWFVRLFVLPMGFFTILALNMHSTIGPATIRECGYAFKPCKMMPYADVRRITYVAGNETSSSKTGAALVLDFKDGHRWSTGDWGDEIDDVDPAVLSILRQKIAIPMTTAKRLEDIPPLASSMPAAVK